MEEKERPTDAMTTEVFKQSKHLDQFLWGGTSTSRNFILSVGPNVTLRTLLTIRAMITEHIKELRHHGVKRMDQL